MMCYTVSIKLHYLHDRKFVVNGSQFKQVGQIKINKVDCRRGDEVSTENRFRDFFREEAQLAGWNEYHLKFLADRRLNANDAIAFVTFRITWEHLLAIKRLEDLKWGKKYLAVRINGFIQSAVHEGHLETIEYGLKRSQISNFNEQLLPSYQLNHMVNAVVHSPVPRQRAGQRTEQWTESRPEQRAEQQAPKRAEQPTPKRSRVDDESGQSMSHVKHEITTSVGCAETTHAVSRFTSTTD